jgi:hypothetical protein
MSYTNLNNPANYQLQSFGQDGMRTISTTQAYVEGEYYRVLVATEDSTLSATSMVGDDLASIDVYAGTTIYGLFTAVTVTAGEVTAYLAGRTDIDDVWAYIRAYGEANGATIEGEDCAKAAISPLLDKYYAKASLVMVPSLYKTSIVYSERPLSTDGELTFTRASSATRVAANGLIEKVRTNLLLQSNSFDTTWSSSSTTETSGQSGYDGTTNAWLLAATSAGGFIFQDVTIAGLVTFSIYAKAGSEIGITLYSTHASQGRYFNLSTGALGGTFIGAPLDSKIESIGSGWYRCSITVSATATNNFRVYVSNGTANVTGNILIQSAQVEAGDIATDYIPTTTVAVSVGPVANLPRLNYPINSDGSVGCPSLLLEPQRTNLILSTSFRTGWSFLTGGSLSYNTSTSPDGYTNAETFVGSAVGSNAAYTLINVTSGSTYTFSVFAKANEQSLFRMRGFSAEAGGSIVFDLSNGTISGATTDDDIVRSEIQDYGNGWYRCICVFEADGTGAALFGFDYSITTSGNLFDVYGPQFELGSYVTSLIPSNGAAVTRLADACSKTGISSLIGQTEGTLFVEATDLFASGTRTIALLYTSGSAFYQMYINASNQVRVDVNGSFLFLGGSIAANTNYKIAFAYKSGEYALYINGTQIATSASTTMPSSLTAYYLGNSLGGEQGGAYNQALIFKTRLSNAQLAELTTL